MRRVTYPKALSSGGALPLRLWLQNVGNTPVYTASQMQLRLKTPEGCLPILVRLAPRVWPVGDTVHNEITHHGQNYISFGILIIRMDTIRWRIRSSRDDAEGTFFALRQERRE